MGLFSIKAKVKPEPIPMEDRPVQYMRFPTCKHMADDDDCGCYSWDVQIGRVHGIDVSADRSLLPSRRGSTKRTLVLLPDDQEANGWLPFYSLANEPIGHADIPKPRLWASSDDTRLVFQVWLIVTRTDDEYDDEPTYEAALRFAKKGQLLFFDEDDPEAFVS